MSTNAGLPSILRDIANDAARMDGVDARRALSVRLQALANENDSHASALRFVAREILKGRDRTAISERLHGLSDGIEGKTEEQEGSGHITTVGVRFNTEGMDHLEKVADMLERASERLESAVSRAEALGTGSAQGEWAALSEIQEQGTKGRDELLAQAKILGVERHLAVAAADAQVIGTVLANASIECTDDTMAAFVEGAVWAGRVAAQRRPPDSHGPVAEVKTERRFADGTTEYDEGPSDDPGIAP